MQVKKNIYKSWTQDKNLGLLTELLLVVLQLAALVLLQFFVLIPHTARRCCTATRRIMFFSMVFIFHGYRKLTTQQQQQQLSHSLVPDPTCAWPFATCDRFRPHFESLWLSFTFPGFSANSYSHSHNPPQNVLKVLFLSLQTTTTAAQQQEPESLEETPRC